MMSTSPEIGHDVSHRQALILVIALLVGTVFISVHAIAHTPPGVASDAMLDVGDGFRISRGYAFPADFTDRPEMTYRYWLTALFILFGPHIFTALAGQVFIALLTAALAYRAGLILLAGYSWRRLGAWVAAGTMVAIPPYLFMIRSPYRAILAPPVVLGTLIALLSAYHSRKRWQWALAGFIASFGLQTYLAAVSIPVWTAMVVGHQLVIPPRGKRIDWREALSVVLGLLPLTLVWLALALLVPGLFLRLEQVRAKAPLTPEFIVGGYLDGIQSFFLTGHHLPTFNAPNAPFLNAALAALAILGVGLAIWRWRRIEGALFLGGMIILSLPGSLAPDPTYPQRRVGVMPLLALLSGWGLTLLASKLVTISRQVHLPRYAVSGGLITASTGLIALSLTGTHIAYQSVFSDPTRYVDPRNWTSIPHNFSMAFQEAMQVLAKVDRPTYVPLWMLDNPAAAFFLQREAFPNVTTWARYGLKEFPEGQFFFPVYWYYHMAAIDESTARVLLLPREKTIVLLPGGGVPDSIAGPPPQPGEPGVNEITNERGWVLARTRPVPRADFAPPRADSDSAPVVGSGLRLLTRQPVEIRPGQPASVLLEWLVTEPQPADVFSVAQLLNQDFLALPGGSDHHVLFYLYPSARWQPGDIVPDWHVISVPDSLPDGIYRLGAGAYVPPNQKRLPVVIPDGVEVGPQLRDLWLWDVIRVPAPKTAQALPADVTRLETRLGEQIRLEGYGLAQNGRTWELSLYWRAKGFPAGDYTIFVHAEHDGKLIAQRDEKPLGGSLPTWAWTPGELITTTYALDFTEDTPDALYVGMYAYPSLVRLPVVRDGVSREDRRILLWSGRK
jgi:hypothetical protein